MKEHFHESKQVPKEVLLRLMQRSNQPAIFRFTLMYIMYIAASFAVVFSWNNGWPLVLLSQFFFAMLACSLFACEHETIHNTAFKSKRLNKAAAFLCGLGHVYPSNAFRELHFMHHRHTHIPGKDPEISLGTKPAPSVLSNIPFYLSWLSGLPLLLFKIGMLINGALGMAEPIRKNLYPFIHKKVRLKLALESWLVIAFHGSLLYIAITHDPRLWALFVGQLTGHCLLALYLSPEHNGLPHEGSILEKTRSIQAYPFVKLLMWNMPYHAEHHAYPAIPFYALPELSKEIDAELVHKEGHWQFNSKVFGL